jgi:hypothetical protein
LDSHWGPEPPILNLEFVTLSSGSHGNSECLRERERERERDRLLEETIFVWVKPGQFSAHKTMYIVEEKQRLSLPEKLHS